MMFVMRRWVVGNSYRVTFGHDPISQMGGGVLSSFESVPGTVYLDQNANMEVGRWPCCKQLSPAVTPRLLQASAARQIPSRVSQTQTRGTLHLTALHSVLSISTQDSV